MDVDVSVFRLLEFLSLGYPRLVHSVVEKRDVEQVLRYLRQGSILEDGE